jgi:hypothetical protein
LEETVTEHHAVMMTEAGSKDLVLQTETKEATTQGAVKTVTARVATKDQVHLLAATETVLLLEAKARDAALAALTTETTVEVALPAVATAAAKVVSTQQKARRDLRPTHTLAEAKAERSVQETNVLEMSVRANLRTDLSVRLK